LENWRGKNDKMSGGVWKVVETKAEKVRMAKTEGCYRTIKCG